jgi:hypothetical protein
MVLPGSPRNPASPQDRIARVKAQLRSWEGQRQEGRLTGKGSERESWETAARVVRGWESQLQGERRQSKELRGESPNGGIASCLQWHGADSTAQHEVSAWAALEGKPGALKGARPVWEGAR